jgi:hypothetical protein
VNLLLTCSTTPEFTRNAFELWNKFCITDWIQGRELVRELAVLIGRTPRPQDASLWDKRKAEQPGVKIITYDEILEEQRTRRARHRVIWSSAFS